MLNRGTVWLQQRDREGEVGEKKPEKYAELNSYRALKAIARALIFTLSGAGNQWKILSRRVT